MSGNDRVPVRRLFEQVDEKIAEKRWVAVGVVSQIRTSDRRVRVKILPTLKETNWIRLISFNGKGSGVMPAVDSCVLILFVEGHDDGAICLGGTMVDDGVSLGSSGDMDITFYDAYGNSIVMSQNGITINANSGNVTINGGNSLQGAVRKSDQIMSGFGPCQVITASTSVFVGG